MSGHRLNLPHMTRVCGKVRHYTGLEADAHLAALVRWEQSIGSSRAGELVTYYCERCEAYHVGHRETGRRVKMEADS